MRILLIHNEYQQPGGEKVAVAEQLKLLRQRGHEVYLYTRDNEEIKQYNVQEKLAFALNTIDSSRTRHEITEIVHQFQPQIAHVHNVFPLISPAVYLQLRTLNVPIVQTIHNYRFMCTNALFYTNGTVCERCKNGAVLPAIQWRCYHDSYTLSALYASAISLNRYRGAFAAVSRFIALTPFIAQKLVEAGIAPASSITVLGNFLPEPTPSRVEPDLEQPYVAFIGRLVPEKGINTLLEALAGTTIRAVILGDGPLAAQAYQYASDHQLHVEFRGHVSGNEKYSILGRALAIVVPSLWYEALPFTVIESASVGTPIIASDLGSLGSLIVEGKTGLKFTSGNSLDLRSKLQFCLSNPHQAVAMGNQAREWFLTHFSEENHYQSLVKLYQQLTYSSVSQSAARV